MRAFTVAEARCPACDVNIYEALAAIEGARWTWLRPVGHRMAAIYTAN